MINYFFLLLVLFSSSHAMEPEKAINAHLIELDMVRVVTKWRRSLYADDLFNGLTVCNEQHHYLARPYGRVETRYFDSKQGYRDSASKNEYRLAPNGIIIVQPNPPTIKNYKNSQEEFPFHELIELPFNPDQVIINKGRTVLAVTEKANHINKACALIIALNNKKITMLEHFNATPWSWFPEIGFKDDCCLVARYNLTEQEWNLTEHTRCDY